MAIPLNTQQTVRGPRRSARIPKKKVFTNEWITEEWESVIGESEIITEDTNTKTTEIFFSTDIKTTTNVLVKYQADSCDNSSDGSPIVHNRHSRKRSSSKRKTADSTGSTAGKRHLEDNDSNEFLTATKKTIDPIDIWEVLVDSNEEFYKMRTECLKNAVDDLLKSMPTWTFVTHSDKWVIYEMTTTDDVPMISKSIVFNEEFYVTINILREEFVCESERPVRTKDELLNLMRELESM